MMVIYLILFAALAAVTAALVRVRDMEDDENV